MGRTVLMRVAVAGARLLKSTMLRKELTSPSASFAFTPVALITAKVVRVALR